MSGPVQAAGAPTPGVWRRMAAFLYEGVLLFGVLWAAGMVYGVATQQRHAMVGHTGLQVFSFLVVGAYFTWFWSRTGQTLPMQTWHIRVVTREGAALSKPRAMARYALAWLWFVPALAAAHVAGFKTGWPMAATLLAGVATYAALARLHPDRQFLHDAVCGTRLVTWHAPRRT